LLSTGTWIGALVVATEQEDQPIAVGMAEHSEQDSLATWLWSEWPAKDLEDLCGVVP
jgi:hypothetical protein